MKSKIRIPRIAIILFIVALIGPGVLLGKYVLNKQPLFLAKNTESLKYMKTVKFSNPLPLRPLPDYQVIVRNNLFRYLGQREIVIPTPLPQTIKVEKQQAPPPDPLYKLAFTGIVQLGSEYTALVEDTSRNKAYYLKKNDKLKDYVVEAINEGSVVLSNGNSKFTATVGSVAYYNSNGQISTSEPRNNQIINQTTVRSSESNSGEQASVNKNSANLSLVEQMKARRKKELEQQ